MHRTLLNEFRLEWTILPISPLLVSGEEGRFVRTAHPDTHAPTAFLPGGSLKGLLRAAGVSILESSGRVCCTPRTPCHDRDAVIKAGTDAARYRAHCPACQLFGSRVLRGRVTCADAFPFQALDELLIHPLADGETCEVVNGDAFTGLFTLYNFERWQIGLLGAVFAQINAGNFSLGAHRNTGMGRIMIRFNTAAITYFGFYSDRVWENLAERVHGVGALIHELYPQAVHTFGDYGFIQPDLATERDLPSGVQFDSGFGYARLIFQGDSRAVHNTLEQLFFRQLSAWEQYSLGGS
jgi:CRISPR/Cas system CSM-associated protein Csm3 (group 7 of RAMP superfamily)